ncbi:MAG TPA: hypothetical protein VMV69_29215, partial [Pirellulales bacterium]|nr:hypothetical protein [Pirellulales bacterium]
RSAGVPECRSAGVPECRSAGVPECRSAGVPECRSAGVPECRSAGVRKEHKYPIPVSSWVLVANWHQAELPAPIAEV